MSVSFNRLFHLLIERDITTARLQHKAGFFSDIILQIKQNGYTSLKLIETLDGSVNDILKFIPDEVERGRHNDRFIG